MPTPDQEACVQPDSKASDLAFTVTLPQLSRLAGRLTRVMVDAAQKQLVREALNVMAEGFKDGYDEASGDVDEP